jgi:hypothetical protein
MLQKTMAQIAWGRGMSMFMGGGAMGTCRRSCIFWQLLVILVVAVGCGGPVGLEGGDGDLPTIVFDDDLKADDDILDAARSTSFFSSIRASREFSLGDF